MPAFIGGWVIMVPIRLAWPTVGEAWDLVPSVTLAALLWYRVASRLETRSTIIRRTWLSAFAAASLMVVFIPMDYYTAWQLYGALMWCVAALFLRRSRMAASEVPSQLA
jgi:hypothetical protein